MNRISILCIAIAMSITAHVAAAEEWQGLTGKLAPPRCGGVVSPLMHPDLDSKGRHR